MEYRLQTTLKEITLNGMLLSAGEQVPARTITCTVGNATRPFMAKLSLPLGRGKILVGAIMQVKESKNLWAPRHSRDLLNHAALVSDVTRERWCPPTAQYAMRHGRQATGKFWPSDINHPPRNFQFKGLGNHNQTTGGGGSEPTPRPILHTNSAFA